MPGDIDYNEKTPEVILSEALSIREAAIWLGITESAINTWKSDPTFPQHREPIGSDARRKLYLVRKELLLWIQEKRPITWRLLVESGRIIEERTTRTFYKEGETLCQL